MLTRPIRALLAFVLVFLMVPAASFAYADDAGSVGEVVAGSDAASDEVREAIGDEAEVPDVRDAVGDELQVPDEQETLLPFAVPKYETPLPEGRYIIRSAVSDTRVLDIAGGSSASGANLQLHSSNMTTAQLFEFSYDEQGLYTIKNVNSKRVLDVQWEQTKQGTNVWQYASNNSLAQKWIVTESGSGYRIATALNSKRVLDVTGASNHDGANIQIWSSNGTAAQLFYAIPEDAGITSNKTVEEGFYSIVSRLPGSLVLDIAGANESNGTALQLYSWNGSLAQLFYIKRESGGFYSIRPLNSGGALDVSGGNVVASTPVVQWGNNNSDAQRWAIVVNDSDGSLTFVAKKSGLVLDVRGGKASAGNSLQIWQANGTAAQRFNLKPVTHESLSEGIYNVIPWAQKSKCIDIASGSRANGANAQAYRANGSTAQKFQVKRVAANTFAFRALNSGLYLTAGSGNVYQANAPAGGPNTSQQWVATFVLGGFTLLNVGSGQAMALTAGGMDGHDIKTASPSSASSQVFRVQSTAPINMGIYTISSFGGHLVDSANGSVRAGNNIQMFHANGTAAQKWRLEQAWGDYFSIRCVRSQRALDIKNGSTANGARMQLWDYNGTNAQLWRAIPTDGGWYYLQSASGMYLSAAKAGNTNGENVVVTTKNTSDAQKFRFSATTYNGPVGTYADVNLTTQKMQYVRDGVLLLECDVVTGAPWGGRSTPTGTFTLRKKQSPSVLIGADYAAPVSFWMPFIGNAVGFHDATWQPRFGGDWYRNNGSHGCVNMPYWAASQLYGWISVGDTVRVHY
jgi:lipoprotein-anchoring transpeptidase ErfK/SrfK